MPTEIKFCVTQTCTCGCKSEQSYRIGDQGAAAADFHSNILLAHAKFSGQPRVPLRLFNRIEVRSLQVLDERKLEHFEVIGGPDNHRHLGQTQLLRGAPPSLSRDQFMPAIGLPDNERLNDPMLPN